MLARYTIVRELGRGAMGAVYAARDRETGALVALKTIDPALLKSDATLAERLLRRARAAARLAHPNIARVLDAGEMAGTTCAAVELVEGESLRAVLDRGPIGIARAIRITRDIAGALAYAHLEGAVHGALKPSNVIVSRSGAPKVTDFALGRPARPYVAPEQARGDTVDHRCDIYSLGVLFYEMLTRRPPDADARPPSEANQNVPRALDGIVLAMLAREPAQRMPGAPIVVAELQRLEEGLGFEPAAASAAPEREDFDYSQAMAMMERESRAKSSPAPRTGIVPALALGLAVLGIGTAGFLYYRSETEERLPAPLPVAEAPKEPAPPPPQALPTSEAKQAPVASRAPERAPEPDPLPLAAPAPEPEPVRVAMQSAPPPAPAKVPEQKPAAATARLVLAIEPGGEIYVDGEHHGKTPPITTLDLEPGMHRIEVRSGSRKPYLTYMTVQAGDERRIRHDFNAKRMRPPG